MSEEQEAEARRLIGEANRLASLIRTEKLSLPRLPTLLLPKSDAFDLYVKQLEVFKDHCGFTPSGPVDGADVVKQVVGRFAFRMIE